MKQKAWLCVLLGGFILVVAATGTIAFIFWNKLPFGYSVELRSEVPGFRVSFNNKRVLDEILRARQVFEKGIYDLVGDQYQKIHKLIITLVPTEQPKLITYWSRNGSSEKTNTVSGDYSVDGSVLNFKIYIIPGESGLQQTLYRNSVVNSEFLQLLLVATPTRYAPETPQEQRPDTRQAMKDLVNKYLPYSPTSTPATYPLVITQQ